jgi:hypothetical protein
VGESNFESILLISLVADLSDPLSPLQDAGMQVYTSFSGAGIIVLSMGDGILTHLPLRSPDPTLGSLIKFHKCVYFCLVCKTSNAYYSLLWKKYSLFNLLLKVLCFNF